MMRYDYDMLRQPHPSGQHGSRRALDAERLSPAKPSAPGTAAATTSAPSTTRCGGPLGLFVLGTDAANSDPRTTGRRSALRQDRLRRRPAQRSALNLRTRVFQHCDAAGVVTNKATNPATSRMKAYDFKGNLLRSSRSFVADYKALPDLVDASGHFPTCSRAALNTTRSTGPSRSPRRTAAWSVPPTTRPTCSKP